MKTPQQTYPNLAKFIGVPEIYLKREDLHKYGSHKGRSIPLMIKNYVRNGARNFVISSSGNAALSAILATEQHNKNNKDKQITLKVFVGQKIDLKKLTKLESACETNSITIEKVERPKQTAFQLQKNEKLIFLRQSTDDLALEGYIELANELIKIPNIQAVFVPTSSGTTAQAIAQTFLEKKENIEVHIIQTTAHHPIAELFDNNFKKTDSSIAGAIVDNIAHRKNIVIEKVKETNGNGWVVDDEQIKKAIKIIMTHTNVNVSANGAIGVAGLIKAVDSGMKFTGPVVCLVCGE